MRMTSTLLSTRARKRPESAVFQNGSRVVVSLIGERTRDLYKCVRWELEQALTRSLPLIGVNLNGRRAQDSARCPPGIRDALVVYVSFHSALLQHALEHWPNEALQAAV